MHLSACIRENKPVGFPQQGKTGSDSDSLILAGQKFEEQRISVLEFVSLMCVHYTPAHVF